MKTTELMVGDIVDSDGVTTVIHSSDFGNLELISSFKPIPITSRILEKNEFYLMDETYWVNDFGFPFALLPNDGRFELNILDWCDSDNDICVFYIKYVHELQHILKLCRISKEIEL